MRSKTPGYFLRFRIVIIGLFLLLGVAIYVASYIPPPAVPEFTPPPPLPTETPLPLPTDTPTRIVVDTPTATPTPLGDTIIYTIFPKVNDIGWVQSDEEGNYFSESYLYAGLRGGTLHHGAMLFDLSGIPINAEVVEANIQLTGLVAEGLQSDNLFVLNILTSDINDRWALHGYEAIHQATAEEIPPFLMRPDDLGVDKVNKFEFSAGIRSIVEDRLQIGDIAFRLDSLTPDREGWFAWDTGYGPNTKGNKPVLRLMVRPAENQLIAEGAEVGDLPVATPTPISRYVVVTDTPVPENVLTRVAIDLTATYEFKLVGEPTEIPVYWATPWVLESTPTPENEATGSFWRLEATVLATVYGTATPLPNNAVTITPTPSYVIITSTPTPESVLTAAAELIQITTQAERVGTATPLPPNWVTPLVVTSTPTPVNDATVQYFNASFLTTGTPTLLPDNAQTATPTPVYIVLQGELPPMTPTPTPTFTPGPIPTRLIGMIAFQSDRTGQTKTINPNTGATEVVFDENEEREIYVINPDGTELALLTDRWPYDLALAADQYSIDGRFRVFTKDAIRYSNVDGKLIREAIKDEETGEVLTRAKHEKDTFERTDAPALYWYDAHYDVEEQLTRFGLGIAYGGVWSPTREQIAFVSNDSGNDEIWVINRDRTGILQLTRDNFNWWDKHPSWSPDGNQIVFWSNRTGHAQIWVMDRDGNNLYSLSRTGFNDWNPVWLKYPGIPKYNPPP